MPATADVHASTRAKPAAHVSVMSLTDGLALGESRWEALRASVGPTSPFATWAWNDAWQATAPPEERDAAVVVSLLDDGHRLQAVLPLATRRVKYRRMEVTALTWAAGDLGCPDHLDILATPSAALDGVVEALSDMEWDMLQLDGIVSGAVGAPRLQAALRARGLTTLLRPQWRCPSIDLPASWEKYLATRSPARRHSIRWREHSLARKANFAVTFYEDGALERGLRHLTRLHDARWRGEGVFDGRLDALHRRFAPSFARLGATWLSTIDVNGEPISAWYGFVDRDTLHFYQTGRSPSWTKFGVGGVHIGLMIQRAIAHGLRRFDFLRGEEPYKADWTTTSRWTHQLVAFRRSPTGLLLRLADQAGRLRDQLTRSTAATVNSPWAS